MQQYQTVEVNETRDPLRTMRLNSLGSLFYFIRVALRRHRLTRALHLPLCRTFERWHIKDVVEIPRDHFKSTCASEGLAMWRALPAVSAATIDLSLSLRMVRRHWPSAWTWLSTLLMSASLAPLGAINWWRIGRNHSPTMNRPEAGNR